MKQIFAMPLRPGVALTLALCCFFVISGCAAYRAPEKSYRNAAEMYNDGVKEYQALHYEASEKIFTDLMERYPLNPIALDGEILLADVLYSDEKYEEARVYYTDFVALHPAHSKASYAMFQKGMCYFRDVLSADRDQTNTRKAIIAFEDLAKDFPGSSYDKKSRELVRFLKNRLAERELYVGRFYFKTKKYRSALSRLQVILSEYPDSAVVDEALYYIVKSYIKLGEEDLAKDALNSLLADYPSSSYTKSAHKMLGG